MNKVTIDRELLERLLYVMDNYVTHETPEEDELRAILAAPHQPEGESEGLEVVAYMVGRYTTDQLESAEVFARHHARGITELCRLSDAQRAIAELDRKVWEWSSAATAEAHRVDELKAERDTLRQHLAELQKRTCNKADAQSVVNAYTELWIAETEVTKKLRTQLAEAHAALAEIEG